MPPTIFNLPDLTIADSSSEVASFFTTSFTFSRTAFSHGSPGPPFWLPRPGATH